MRRLFPLALVCASACAAALAGDAREGRRGATQAGHGERPFQTTMLSDDARQRLQQALCRVAESELDRRSRSEAFSDRFHVITDLPRPLRAERVLEVLEASFDAFERLLGPPKRDRFAGKPVKTYVFRSALAYQRVLNATGTATWSGGFYHPAGLIALHGRWQTPQYFTSSLLHEATHALVDRYLRAPDVVLPRWLEEGFADYLGHSDYRQGALQPGKHRTHWGGIVYDPHDDRYEPIATTARTEALRTKRDLSRGRAVSFAELLEIATPDFYGPQRQTFYAEAWMAIEFLRHGRPEWATGAFPRFMEAVAAGETVGQALRDSYAAEPADLNEQYRRYALGF